LNTGAATERKGCCCEEKHLVAALRSQDSFIHFPYGALPSAIFSAALML